MIKKPHISVVIAAYNDFENLRILLEKIFQSKYKDFEVVIVDDASKENLSLLKKHFPVRYFRNQKNFGAAKTRNIAVQKARGEIVLSLDNDVKPLSDLLIEVDCYFKKHPETIAVTGFPGTGIENPSFFARYKYLRDWSYWHLEMDKTHFCFFRPAIGAIRRNVFLKLGGYDQRYCRPGTPAVEDLEFSYRLARIGKIVFNPNIIVGHPFGGLKKLLKTYFQRTALFLEIFKEKRLFSGVATTRTEALTILLAPLTLISFFIVIFYPLFWSIALIFLAGFIFRQRKFLFLCFKREGFLFTVGAFMTSWLLYLDINVGTLYALFFIIPKEITIIYRSLTR